MSRAWCFQLSGPPVRTGDGRNPALAHLPFGQDRNPPLRRCLLGLDGRPQSSPAASDDQDIAFDDFHVIAVLFNGDGIGATRRIARETGNHHALGVIPPTLIKRAFLWGIDPLS